MRAELMKHPSSVGGAAKEYLGLMSVSRAWQGDMLRDIQVSRVSAGPQRQQNLTGALFSDQEPSRERQHNGRADLARPIK